MLQNLPDDKRQIVEEIVAAVSALAGVQAAVLAGSYARGTARPDSDVDLGIYYREQAPFSVGKLRQAVERFDVTGSPTVTDFYEWGPWVNGGAWIATENGHVDLLYRNIDHISRRDRDLSSYSRPSRRVGAVERSCRYLSSETQRSDCE